MKIYFTFKQMKAKIFYLEVQHWNWVDIYYRYIGFHCFLQAEPYCTIKLSLQQQEAARAENFM